MNITPKIENQPDPSREAALPLTTKQRGSNTTEQSFAGSVGVDYLTVSLPHEEKPRRKMLALASLFRTSGEQLSGDHGYKGYDVCGGYGQAMMRSSRDGASGDVLMRIPGRALEWLRGTDILTAKGDNTTDQDICAFFVEHGFRATRLDTAMDTADVRVNPGVVEKLLNDGHFTCTAQSAGLNASWKLHEGRKVGDSTTVYVGGRSSTRFMRCYDKRAEVLRKLNKNIGHLTRFEIEHKGDAAEIVLKLIADKGAACIPGIFRAWISFKDPNDDATRVERRREVDWWEQLVGGVEPITLGLQRGVATPERSVHWLEKQVAKTLYLVKKHGLMPEIEKAIENKATSVKPSEWQKWIDYVARMKMEADKRRSNSGFGGNDK